MGAAETSPGGIIELPADMQNELQQLEARGDRLTHYELLGVGADADGGTVRRAYLEKSKRFHPDAWYRKETGKFGPLLSKWFQRLSAAYQVLSDEEMRAGYDRDHRAELSQTDRVAVERRELSVAEEERRARERRERLLRTKGFARIGAARKLYEEALESVLNGERTQAIFALKAARELDPKRHEISAKLVELEREQAKARANSALASAKEREEKRRFPEAIAVGAARCAMETGDARAATIWASRAVELNPDDGSARWLLSRLFVSAGMKARARTELAALLNKNPDHKEAKALLRTL
ncbi:MAG: tetratricopeptide repeat protein [Deltaproteobacteria bacterium]|nr:MAG: tetratricopeptide repeat protein [Deltaproteobacteria bacterium]